MKFLTFLILLAGCATAPKPPTHTPAQPEPQGRYADINGIRMYYELRGQTDGVPLVLLNGGGSTIDTTYGRILPFFEPHHRIVALEEQGHGRTSDRGAPFRFETSAEDVVALLKTLNIDKADIFGFSNGASVALQIAIRHPEMVRKLIFVGSFTKRAGAPPHFFDFFKDPKFGSMPQALKDAFLKVNPDAEKLRNMFEKDVERMAHFKDVPDSDLKKIKAPTLVMMGDKDVATVEHAVFVSRTIPHARLAVLEGTHGEYLGEVLGGKPGSQAPAITAMLVDQFLREAP